jgi:RNA polymerase sigma factor (sigma-70 family)
MTAFHSYIDEDCWLDFLGGDKIALDRIVKANYNHLYNYGRKFTPDADLVKDCIQELFLALWKNRNSIGPTASVRNYLLKAMRRRLQQALAQAGNRQADSIEFLAIGQYQSPETDRVLQETRLELNEKIVQAFSSLSRRQQEIIYLRFYLEADTREIAHIMGLNRQSVYNLLKSALDRLKTVSLTLFEQRDTLGVVLLLLAAV